MCDTITEISHRLFLVWLGPSPAPSHYLNQRWPSLLAQMVIFRLHTISALTHWGRDKMDAILPDNIFKFIFLNANLWIVIKISQKFVPKGAMNNIPALVQVMAWHRPGDKPLSEPMMVKFTDAYMHHSALMSYGEVIIDFNIARCYCRTVLSN